MKQSIHALITSLLIMGARGIPARQIPLYDLVVYGGTSAGVTAAVQAKRMNQSVIIVCPDKHLGGLSSGGLGWTDTGNKQVIGGLAREFYHRVWKTYHDPESWVFQKREDYGNRGQGTPAIDGAQRTMWIFEPHVAEQVFEDLIKEHEIPVLRDEWLDREKGVAMKNGKILSITMLSGKTFGGKMFIDATYEGDLMAAAKINYHVGREANRVYDETWNGVQVGVLHHQHHFKKPVDPYRKPGDPSSGLLPRISGEPPGVKGEGDHRVQAYCFRMCLTDHPDNRIPFAKPEGYDPDQYALLLRIFETGWDDVFHKFDPIPNQKTDTNNHGPFSTDNIGMNYAYPDGSYKTRKAIIQEHETYQKGLMYFLANDPRVPEKIRTRMSSWGLPKDEFKDNGHWPHQIYVREARRMIGNYVMTEHDVLCKLTTPDSVGMGSYTMDSHNVQRYIKPDGMVQNEGDIGVRAPRPYMIAYGSLLPKKSECTNLLVPVACSSSHIAFGSIRMEPVFMILGQSAATAAALSLKAGVAPQDLDYALLRDQLRKDEQILEWSGPVSQKASSRKTYPGIVIDEPSATFTGSWITGNKSAQVGPSYHHDEHAGKGKKTATFTLSPPKPGTYRLFFHYVESSNRATKVPVTIHTGGQSKNVTINQREPAPDGVDLGRFELKDGAKIVVSNQGTDGYVVVDAVRLVPVGP